MTIRRAETAKSWLSPARRDRPGEFVPRNLLDDELVQWFVGIQPTDHPVTVLPRPAAVLIGSGGAFRISVSGNIEPVSCPVLAVVRRAEQLVHELFKPAVFGIVLPSVYLFGGRRQSGQSKGSPFDKAQSTGVRRKRIRACLRQNQRINSRAGGRGEWQLRNTRTPDRLE